MHLYIDAMDAVLVEYLADGRVRLDGEGWSVPTLQERRAIIHSARMTIEQLQELIAAIEQAPIGETR